MTYVIAEPCVDVMDRSCIEECPVDCIYEGARMLYIQPDECVDCGACEPVCPVEAIYYEDDVPDQWKNYTKANADFFAELGSPGGASKVGVVNDDPPLIVELPPQNEDEVASVSDPSLLSRLQPGSPIAAIGQPVVFISYRRFDQKFSSAVAAAMGDLKIEYFFDRENLTSEGKQSTDQELVQSIEAGLENCTHLVGIVTAQTAGSWWVPFEIGGARGRGRETMYIVFHDLLPADVPEYVKVSPITWSRSDFVDWLISLKTVDDQRSVTAGLRQRAVQRLVSFMSA